MLKIFVFKPEEITKKKKDNQKFSSRFSFSFENILNKIYDEKFTLPKECHTIHSQ